MRKPTALIASADHETADALARKLEADGYSVGSIWSYERGHAVPAVGPETVLDAQVEFGEHEMLKSAVDRVAEQLGQLSLVVFNSCPVRSKGPLSLTPQELVEDLNASTGALLVVVQQALSRLASGAHIVTVITGAAARPTPAAASVGIHQAGLRNLTKVIDQCLRDDGIRAVAITVEATDGARQSSPPERTAAIIAGAFPGVDLSSRAPHSVPG